MNDILKITHFTFFIRKLMLEKLRCIKRLMDVEAKYKEQFIYISSNSQFR